MNINRNELILGLVDNSIHVHQKKYCGNFQSRLKCSKEFVDEIITYLKSYGFLARGEDDKNPFLDVNGNIVRLWDIMAIDTVNFSTMYFEAKDFPRCVCYEATGLPKRYIDEKMMLANKGSDIYLIFKEDMEWVEKKAEKKHCPTQKIIDELIREGFAEIKNSKVHFIPYGNNLRYLMQEENQRVDLEWIKCSMNQYKGEDQYLWKISSMLPISKLLERKLKQET